MLGLGESTNLQWLESSLPDGVDAYDGDPVSRDDTVGEVAVTVELHVARELPLRNCIRTLLQLQNLNNHKKKSS